MRDKELGKVIRRVIGDEEMREILEELLMKVGFERVEDQHLTSSTFRYGRLIVNFDWDEESEQYEE